MDSFPNDYNIKGFTIHLNNNYSTLIKLLEHVPHQLKQDVDLIRYSFRNELDKSIAMTIFRKNNIEMFDV